MNDEQETRDNTPKMIDQLEQRLREWLEREAPRMVSNRGINHMSHASITFRIFAGETGYLDDDTPCLSARVEEKASHDEIEGWHADE